MKAINIASGVAVTALALAISAQANAAAHGGDTETTFSYTGSMEAVFVMDMEAETKDVDLDEGGDFDAATAGKAWGLEMEVGVVHGPFSGSVGVRNNDGVVEAFAGDIVITDGPISFGQVGSVISTHDYAYDMGESSATGDLDEGAPVEAGFRYTMNGLKVQLEGQNDSESPSTDYGIGAAYEGSADAVSFVVDANVRASDEAADDAEAYTYVGAGVTYTADLFTAKAGFNQYGQDTKISEYGFEFTVTPIENASAYVKGVDLDASSEVTDDSAYYLFGATYTMDMIGLTAEYTFTTADGGDEVFAEVTYTQDKISAYADVTLGNLDAPEGSESYDPQIGVGVAYTQDNGVKYAVDYDTQGDVNEDATAENQLKLSAAYAF